MDTNNKSDLTEITESVRKYALAAVSESRYKHSVRVAETCVMLCRRYGLDESLGYFVGIAHDICKSMDGDVLLTLPLCSLRSAYQIGRASWRESGGG